MASRARSRRRFRSSASRVTPPRYAIRATSAPARSAEREAVRLDAGVEELDLEAALGDRPSLADELVRALRVHEPGGVLGHVGPDRVGREPPVEVDPERDGRTTRRRPHDEVDVAGLELEGDAPAGLV